MAAWPKCGKVSGCDTLLPLDHRRQFRHSPRYAVEPSYHHSIPSMISRRTLLTFFLAAALLLVPTFLIVHPQSPAFRLKISGEESFSSQLHAAEIHQLGEVIMVRSLPPCLGIHSAKLIACAAENGQCYSQGSARECWLETAPYHGPEVSRRP